MKLRSFSRFFAEAFQSIGRNLAMSIASIVTIALTLFICGVFAIIVMNINNLATDIEDTVEIQAFLVEDLPEMNRQQVEADISAIEGVETVTFVPKEQAIEEMAKQFGETTQDFIESMGGNPLPDSFLVRVQTADDVVPTAEQMELVMNVDKVSYGKGTVEKMFNALQWVRYFGIGIIIFLIIASIVLVAFNIKMTVANRKWEIVIMRYVGASNWYVRWPFCIAGMVLGLLGSIIAVILLYAGYGIALNQFNSFMAFTSLIRPDIYFIYMYIAIVIIGIFLGAFGSILSLNVYLREKRK